MNLKLKAVYFCYTSKNRWGKGYSVDAAKKNAGITSKKEESSIEYYVMAALLNNPTDEELKNMHDCITADQVSGSPIYYDVDRSYEDDEQIMRLHVGWLTIEKSLYSK